MSSPALDPAKFAEAFCRIITKWLSPHELAVINRSNCSPAYRTCCATHDFCDANQAVLDVLAEVNLNWDKSLEPSVSKGWMLARNACFEVDRVCVVSDRQSQTGAVGRAFKYDFHVEKQGTPVLPMEFSDWYADDRSAQIDCAEILRQQGYDVARVYIGQPCVAVIQ